MAVRVGRLPPLLAAIGAVTLATAAIGPAGAAHASVSRLAATKLAGVIAGSGSSGVAATRLGAALPAKGYGKGAGYCTGYPGGVTSSYKFMDVYACEGTTTGATTFDNPGTSVYAWQCVELAARFLWAVDGIWAGPGSGVQDGADLVSVVHSNDRSISVGTPGPGSVPAAGDVISLGPGGGSDPQNGHTAVVISADPGTGRFRIMSENAPDDTAGEQSLKVDLSGGHDGEVLFFGAWTQASWLELNHWGAITAPLPADASPTPDAQLFSVSCPSTSWCVAVGDYDTSSGTQEGLVLTGSGPSWTAMTAPVPAGAASAQSTQIQSVACPSPSRCVAVGDYIDSSGNYLGFLLSWSGGPAWTAIQAPVPPPDPGDQPGGASLDSVACSSAAMCVAAGTYSEYDASAGSSVGYGLLETWSAGMSWTAARAPVPAGGDASSAHFQSGTSAACSSSGTCLAAGTFADSADPSLPLGLLETWSGGSWTAAEAPVPAGTDLTNGQVAMDAAACPSSTCVATGLYQTYDGSAQDHGLVVTGAGSAWTIAYAGSDQDGFGSVACPSVSSCVAGGTGVLLTGAGTSWQAVAAPSPAEGGLLDSVSCPSSSSCAVAADASSGYWDGEPDGLVLTGSGSAWTSTLVPLPPGYGESTLNSISCASVSVCVAVGSGVTGSPASWQGVILSDPNWYA
jgi:hypothetical protein